jgi:hypothetical protein
MSFPYIVWRLGWKELSEIIFGGILELEPVLLRTWFLDWHVIYQIHGHGSEISFPYMVGI